MSARFEALELTWTLATPMVAPAHPLHLDALIAFAMTQEALRSGAAPDATIRSLAEDLPLRRAEQGDQWCWAASALHPENVAHSMRYYTRKTDSYDYATRMEQGQLEGRVKFPLKPYAQKIDTQRGRMKQLFKFFPVKQVAVIKAWCIGDADRIGELLDPAAGLVTHLGAKARMGLGRIASFDLQVCSDADCHWERRALPWPCEGLVPMRVAVRPPYWDQVNVVDAFVPPEIFA